MTNKQKDLHGKKALLLAELNRSLAMQTLVPGCFERSQVSHRWRCKGGDWAFTVLIKQDGITTEEYVFEPKDIPAVLRATQPKGE